MDPAFKFLLEVFGISAAFGFVFVCFVYGKRVERSHSFKTGRFYGHASIGVQGVQTRLKRNVRFESK